MKQDHTVIYRPSLPPVDLPRGIEIFGKESLASKWLAAQEFLRSRGLQPKVGIGTLHPEHTQGTVPPNITI